MGTPGMKGNSAKREPPQARNLAVLGALLTGVVGVSMAIYSVIVGEQAGGAALLAAAALAFGLLALSLDRSIIGSTAGALGFAQTQASESRPAMAAGNGRGSDGGATHAALPMTASQADAAPIDAQPITPREREVLALVAEGYSNKLISGELGISERTVKNHLTATMTKLRAFDRTHAVVTAVRLGWLDIYGAAAGAHPHPPRHRR